MNCHGSMYAIMTYIFPTTTRIMLSDMSMSYASILFPSYYRFVFYVCNYETIPLVM